MKSFLGRSVCVAVLIGLLLSLATGSFGPKWIAHQLSHDLEVIAHVTHTGDLDDGDADHKTMHATVQLPSLPSAEFDLRAPGSPGIIRQHHKSPPVATAPPGAPFRPPRA